MPSPPVQYARNGDVQVAYQVVGDGSIDVLMLPGWTSHLTLEWEELTLVRFMELLTSFARVVRFDKRGTGLSDRPPGIATLEERMEECCGTGERPGTYVWQSKPAHSTVSQTEADRGSPATRPELAGLARS